MIALLHISQSWNVKVLTDIFGKNETIMTCSYSILTVSWNVRWHNAYFSEYFKDWPFLKRPNYSVPWRNKTLISPPFSFSMSLSLSLSLSISISLFLAFFFPSNDLLKQLNPCHSKIMIYSRYALILWIIMWYFCYFGTRMLP